jgi:hypothetical protein
MLLEALGLAEVTHEKRQHQAGDLRAASLLRRP